MAGFSSRFVSVRNLQSLLHGRMNQASPSAIRPTLEIFGADPRIRSLRLRGLESGPIQVGVWSTDPQADSALWVLPEHGVSHGTEVDLDRLTYVRAPFSHSGRILSVELLIDGPAGYSQAREK